MTGGAGYIGSHAVAALVARGDDVVVVDNLSAGHRAAVDPGARLVVADLADGGAVEAVLAESPWDAVLHFAGLIEVGASMREPMRYLIDNAMVGTKLIGACVHHGVKRFVLSSTAAVFGSVGRITNRRGRADRSARRMARASGCWSARCIGPGACSWIAQRRAAVFSTRRARDPAGRLCMRITTRSIINLIPLAIDAVLSGGRNCRCSARIIRRWMAPASAITCT